MGRAAEPPLHYLVGTPEGRLGQLEAELLKLPWQQAREGVDVKLLPRTGELYVLARSKDRVAKERAMRRRQLKKLWARLAELKLVEVKAAEDGALTYTLRKKKLRETIHREGRYLRRANLSGEDPAKLWHLYMLLVQVEEAFKNRKGDLAVRPIHHRLEHRIEAQILVAFLAFGLHATLRYRLRLKAPGLTPRAVLEQLSAMQMLDVHFPTTDGRTLIFRRYTMPDKVQKLLLAQLALELPPQTPPRITSQHSLEPLRP